MTDLIPYLAAHDASAAITFYRDAFGATEVQRWTDPSTGKVGHAELDLAGRRLFLADEWPEGGVRAPQPGAGVAVSLVIEVDDVDAVFDAAVRLGARVDRPVTEARGDRAGWLIDPFGHRWNVSTRLADLDRDELQREAGGAYEIR